jgi:phosphatidylinositol alpha-1,6-mannosyltransferase
MPYRGRVPSKRPRLLILTPDYPPSPGGIQLMAERLASGIAGFDSHVLTLNAPGAASFDEESVASVRRVGATRLPRSARIVELNAEAIGRAVTFRPDLTLSMHIVTSPAAAAIRTQLGARMVQYFHAEEIGARPKLAAFAASRADLVIAVSRYTTSLVEGTGAKPRSLRVIPPGVDVPADPAPLTAEAPTVLTVARMEERYKGHDIMCRSLPLLLAKVPDARWVVIGEGRLRSGIEALLRSYAVSQAASFLGAVDDQERDLWLRRAHVLAMPSRLPAEGFPGEGFGIAYVEAGAFGKPVVAGRAGGALESVIDGETGLLVNPNDPLDVAEAITRLLDDPALAARLGAGGRAHAETLSWPTIIARVEEVLLEQLGSPGLSN